MPRSVGVTPRYSPWTPPCLKVLASSDRIEGGEEGAGGEDEAGSPIEARGETEEDGETSVAHASLVLTTSNG